MVIIRRVVWQNRNKGLGTSLWKVRQPGSAKDLGGWDQGVHVVSAVYCSLIVLGFQSSFSTGLEPLTLVASKLMLSLLCHHQGWRNGMRFSSGWKSPRNSWPKLDSLSGPGQGAASLDLSLPRLSYFFFSYKIILYLFL